MSITQAITGAGAGGSSGGGGDSSRDPIASAILALAGTEALVVGGVSTPYTDAAGTTEATDVGDGIRSIQNLANGTIGTSGARFIETSATASRGLVRKLKNGDLTVSDDSTRALELSTHPFTSAGEWLVGWVFLRQNGNQGNSPLLALGKTGFTNQSVKFSARSNVYGITNDFNPPTNLGGAITTDPTGFEWLTIARRNSGSTYRILLNGVEVYTGGQTINPGGSDRRPMLFGTAFGRASLQGIFRAAYFGTDISVQDSLDSNLGALAAL